MAQEDINRSKLTAAERSAAMFGAENSERFGEAEQHLSYLQSRSQDISNYLPYLHMVDADDGKLQQAQEYIDALNGIFEDIKNDILVEESDRLVAQALNRDPTVGELRQYDVALKVYEDGDWKKARAKFNVLAKSATVESVRQNAIKSVNLIDKHDWGDDG